VANLFKNFKINLYNYSKLGSYFLNKQYDLHTNVLIILMICMSVNANKKTDKKCTLIQGIRNTHTKTTFIREHVFNYFCKINIFHNAIIRSFLFACLDAPQI